MTRPARKRAVIEVFPGAADRTPGGPPAGLAPGVVQVRLTGAASAISLAAVIIASHPAFAVVQYLPGYANRRDPGERAYLTVHVTDPAVTGGHLS